MHSYEKIRKAHVKFAQQTGKVIYGKHNYAESGVSVLYVMPQLQGNHSFTNPEGMIGDTFVKPHFQE